MRNTVRAIIIKDNALLLMRRNKHGHEYYNLIGGGIDDGETAQQALEREVKEESGVVFTNQRLVITQEASISYGTVYVYLCDYVSGNPKLDPASEESSINAAGQDLYQPVWLDLRDFVAVTFVAEGLKQALLSGLKNGFQDKPILLRADG